MTSILFNQFFQFFIHAFETGPRFRIQPLFKKRHQHSREIFILPECGSAISIIDQLECVPSIEQTTKEKFALPGELTILIEDHHTRSEFHVTGDNPNFVSCVKVPGYCFYKRIPCGIAFHIRQYAPDTFGAAFIKISVSTFFAFADRSIQTKTNAKT